MALPDPVDQVVGQYLESVDALLPGVVEGLYLVGSTALDDFQPGVSDVDFMAVTSAPLDEGAVDALASVHATIGADDGLPALEGPYVTFDELRARPAEAGEGVFHHGVLDTGRAGRSPIEWVTLARHGIAVRGPGPDSLDISTDPDELTAWTRDNLDIYWAPWVARSRGATPTAMAMLSDWGVAWGVLGVSRTHYTLSTGAITSKSGAGRYALDVFPSCWHGVVHEAMRCRPRPLGPPGSLEAAMDRRDEVIAFMEFAIDAARSVPPTVPAGKP